MTSLQFNLGDEGRVIVEANGCNANVTLTEVDLSELPGQVSIDDLLDAFDYSDIADYLQKRKEEDE